MRADDDGPSSRYLAEWYVPRHGGSPIAGVAQRLREALDAIPDDAHRPELVHALEVPADAYAFGVFVAESAESVVDACRSAGLPADRVTAAVEATP